MLKVLMALVVSFAVFRNIMLNQSVDGFFVSVGIYLENYRAWCNRRLHIN
jgi:hypothetical protein